MAFSPACLVTAVASLATLTSPPQATLTTMIGPTAVLGRLLVPGHGVSISETSKVWTGDDPNKPTSKFQVRGVLAFGIGKPVAGEVTRVSVGGKRFTFRVVGDVTYGSGGVWSEMLPAGKTWARSSSLRLKPYQLSEQSVDIFEPATLHRVLTTRRTATPGQIVHGVPTTRYSGVVTTKSLCAVSLACREAFGKSDVRISWWIWLNGRGQIARLITKWVRPKDSIGGVLGGGAEANTYYSGWGSRVVVKIPPADQVAKVG